MQRDVIKLNNVFEKRLHRFARIGSLDGFSRSKGAIWSRPQKDDLILQSVIPRNDEISISKQINSNVVAQTKNVFRVEVFSARDFSRCFRLKMFAK